MRMPRCCALTGLMLLLCGGMLFPLGGVAAEKPVLILADVSGSMREELVPDTEQEEEMTKVLALKELLLRLDRELLPMTCDTGIYRVRYRSGDKRRYEPFLPIGTRKDKETNRAIAEEFITDYPVFNRRTPLADMLRQLDQQELGGMNGEITLLLISDGRESFYDIEDDEAEIRKQTIDQNDKVRGPLTEVRRLKERYGESLILHTISLDSRDSKDSEDDRGDAMLRRMASIGDGKYFSGVELLRDDSLMTGLSELLCEKVFKAERRTAPMVVAAPPPEPEPEPEPMPEPEPVWKPEPVPVPVWEPEPEPVPVAPPMVMAVEEPQGPFDTDGDGVYDDDDRCPGTPAGAKVNIYGCWVLEGVLFAFDKWDIRSRYYPDLDEVVRILEMNPELNIEIQGHTDSFGSAAYNQKLSQRRAESVRTYLINKGIADYRLSTSGYGFDQPVASNATAEGRQLNRRVELKPIR